LLNTEKLWQLWLAQIKAQAVLFVKQSNWKSSRTDADCMANVISVICCLGLVLLANGLCFGKQLNLLPLHTTHSAQPKLPPSPPLFRKLTLATRLRPLEHFIAVFSVDFHGEFEDEPFHKKIKKKGEPVVEKKRALNKAYQISLFVSTTHWPIPLEAGRKFNYNFQFHFAFS